MNIYNLKYEIPYSCQVNLTSKCNLRCKHCFGNYCFQEKNELSLEEWKKVFDELVKEKVFYVNLSGGEPTQSNLFKEIIKYLNKIGLHYILTTNGVFSKNIRDFILNNSNYLIGIKFSLDGPDEESHCFLRLDSSFKFNPEIFKKTLENIYFFKNHEFSITIATVLHKKNISKMDKFRELIKDINPTSWFISPIIPLGRGKENKSISEFYEHVGLTFWKELEEKGTKEQINVRLIDVPVELKKEGLGAYTCPAALNICEIHSNGIVSPCTLCRIAINSKFLHFQNIKDLSLKEIWEGKVFEKFRSYMNLGCEGCKMLSKCNKCIAQSFLNFNRGDYPAPFCVKNGEKLGLKNLSKYKRILEKNDEDI